MVRAVARIPVLAVQEPAQHAYRIYLEWNLTRTNPVFLLLAPVWIGAALACLHRLDRRAWFLLLVTWVWSVVQFSGDLGAAVALRQYLPLDRDPANWLHVPVLPCAIAFLLLRRLGAGERLAWGLSGALLALLFAGQVGMPPWALLLVPLAGLTMLVGVRWGNSLYRLLEAPTTRRIATVGLTAVLVPLFTGLLDLLLRHTTP